MAVVFRARDERLGRRVALKIMAPMLAANEVFRRRFIREWRAAAAVDDPHIIPVYEAGEADGVLFLAMRLVGGGDVRSLVQRGGPLPPWRATAIISPVASALDAAHAAGLVHRDVKPANMLLDAQPGRPAHVYLSDFGLSKGALSSSGLTGAGQFLGTPNYTAPEQIQGLSADGRTDQYALACSAFELLTGAPPFQRDQGMAVIWAQLRERPPPLSSRRPDLSADADQVFAIALAKAQQDRYATCGDFAEALRAALGMMPYHLAPSTGVTTHPSYAEIVSPGDLHPTSATISASAAAVPASSTSGAANIAEPAATGGRKAAHTSSPASRVHRRQRYRRRLSLPVLAAITFLAATTVAAAALTHSLSLRHVPPSPSSHSSNYDIVNTLTDPNNPALYGSPQSISSLAFSPDGKVLATSDSEGKTYLWNPATGHRIANTNLIGTNAAFSPNSKTVATVGGTNGAFTYLWDIASGRRTATLINSTYINGNSVEVVVFSPDGKTLATANSNNKIYLWNAATKRLTDTLTDPAQHPSPISIAFSPDGKTLAVYNSSGKTYLWDLITKRIATTFADPKVRYAPGIAAHVEGLGPLGPIHPVPSIAFSPDGKTLAIGGEYGRTYLWNLATRRLIFAFTEPRIPGLTGSTQLADSIAFSPDGKILAVSGEYGRTYLWNLATRQLTAALTNPESAGITSVAFRPGGKTLATGDNNGWTYLWNAR
jgi:serine/threonine-protein kinase